MLSLDHLGDAVMATPAIQAMKSTFPQSTIFILTRPPLVPIFEHNPYVDEVLTDAAPWWSENPITDILKPSYWLSYFKKIARFRKEKFDVIIDLRGDLRHILLFGAAARPTCLLGYGHTGGGALLSANVFYSPEMHEIDKKLRLLESLRVNGKRFKPKIWVSPKKKDMAQRFIKNRLGDIEPPIILIDPGAKPVQQWPLERFAYLAQRIRQQIHKPVLVSAGPFYASLAETLVGMVGPEVACLVGKISIQKLIAVVAACDLVVSCDTGVAHIAGAVGTPAVTIFGPTDPARFWHGAQGGLVVRSPNPCNYPVLHDTCRKPGHPVPGVCMMTISKETVEEAVNLSINKIKREKTRPSPEIY